jgi:hypothetical protein
MTFNLEPSSEVIGSILACSNHNLGRTLIARETQTDPSEQFLKHRYLRFVNTESDSILIAPTRRHSKHAPL